MKKVGLVLNAILDLKREDKEINLASIEKKSKVRDKTIYGTIKDLKQTGFIIEDITSPGVFLLNGNPAQIETGFTRLFPEIREIEMLRAKIKSIYTKPKRGRPKKRFFGF